jgi:hypothetical protein
LPKRSGPEPAGDVERRKGKMSLFIGVLVTVAFLIKFGWFWGLLALIATVIDLVSTAVLHGDADRKAERVSHLTDKPVIVQPAKVAVHTGEEIDD